MKKLDRDALVRIRAELKPRQTAYVDDDGCPIETRKKVELWEEDANALLDGLEEALVALRATYNAMMESKFSSNPQILAESLDKAEAILEEALTATGEIDG